MGLDMRPMGRPLPGYEDRFKELFFKLQKSDTPKLSWVDKLLGKKSAAIEKKDELLKEWFQIQTPSYETIKAPRVGRDEEANRWIIEKRKETKVEQSEASIIKDYDGFYVIELAKELDGVPMYISMGQDENVFRGQFIRDCIDLIGKDLADEAWDSKLAAETLDYGNRLMAKADKIAEENNLQYLKTQRIPPEGPENTIESKLHIVFSLAKWLLFYGQNGHGYEADF